MTYRLSESKIKSPGELKKTIAYLKRKKKTIVFTNGCFDLLHYGHVRYLEESKRKGDILVVAVNSDASIKKIKGDKRPIVNQGDRLKIVSALESVDYVVLFKETIPLRLIKLLKPDVLVKGADWDINNVVGKGIVLGYGGKVCTVKLIKGRSTTNLIKEIAKRF